MARALLDEQARILWSKDRTGAIDRWIEVGLPDERALRKACGRARRVVVYTYGGRTADMWWEANRGKLERLDNLAVFNLPPDLTRPLAALAERTMQLQATIDGGSAWLLVGEVTAQTDPIRLKEFAPAPR